MKMTTMKVSIFTFICVFFSFNISMIRSHVLQNDESKLLSLLTVDNFVQDETCAKMIHDNPCVDKVMEQLVNKINNLEKKLDRFSVYESTIEDNFSELHILKKKFDLMIQRQNAKIKKESILRGKQKQAAKEKETKRNDETKNSPYRSLLKLFWHKLQNYDWLEMMGAKPTVNVDNSTKVGR